MEASIQKDRQATWAEVCDALALSALDAPEPASTPEHRPFDASSSQRIGIFAEELAWIELARQAHNFCHN
jgi:hypothetical protein